MISKELQTSVPRDKKNKFQTDRYKLKDYVAILEDYYERKYRHYRIVQIIKKDKYNMYVCKSKEGIYTTITDKEYNMKSSETGKKLVKKVRGWK